ncbi:MAG: hypothetical protein PHY34_00495 [Patescibacteria group bacterium]|nr:hypothetical protein [Patescibacteria group bacterium]MDD5715892.1 hypothetical protein [Patescibacteria group bacterium]
MDMYIEIWTIVLSVATIVALFFRVRKPMRVSNFKLARVISFEALFNYIFVIMLIMNYQFRYLNSIPRLIGMLALYFGGILMFNKLENKYRKIPNENVNQNRPLNDRKE